MPATVIHALVVRATGPRSAQLRTTLREGEIAPGDEVWFTSANAQQQTAVIRAVAQGRRHLLVDIEGPHVADLPAGSYLYRD